MAYALSRPLQHGSRLVRQRTDTTNVDIVPVARWLGLGRVGGNLPCAAAATSATQLQAMPGSRPPVRGIDPAVIGNRLLLHMPEPERIRLAPHLSRVELRTGQSLIDPNIPIRSVLFVESGLASILASTNHDSPMEIGLLGHCDLVGLPLVLGIASVPYRCVVQIPGHALRLGVGNLKSAMNDSKALRAILLRYTQAFMSVHAQFALCGARHSLEQRLARWCLLALERVGGRQLHITHGRLSALLGVRRAGVTTALANLESAGILERNRGILEISNSDRLRTRSCECPDLIQTEYDRLLHPGSRRSGIRAVG